MTPRLLAPFLLSLAILIGRADAFDDDAYVRENGTTLFEDHFDRHESTPDKEEIGNGWTTNSAWRAKGQKQAALEEGALHVTKADIADHGVAIFHDAAFQNGAVRLRFKFDDPGDDLGLDFVDRELKTVHAGHLCIAHLTLKNLGLIDEKTGNMENAVHARIEAGDTSEEMKAFLRSKAKYFPLELAIGEWHTLLVVIDGDKFRATIDGQTVGEFKSPGIAHPTKRMITLAVNHSAWIDDVKVWNLKCDCEE